MAAAGERGERALIAFLLGDGHGELIGSTV
jgi:hypothetical protein